jgi:hypothetical protein
MFSACAKTTIGDYTTLPCVGQTGVTPHLSQRVNEMRGDNDVLRTVLAAPFPGGVSPGSFLGPERPRDQGSEHMATGSILQVTMRCRHLPNQQQKMNRSESPAALAQCHGEGPGCCRALEGSPSTAPDKRRNLALEWGLPRRVTTRIRRQNLEPVPPGSRAG